MSFKNTCSTTFGKQWTSLPISLSVCLLIILYVSYLLYLYPPSFSIVFGFNFQIENRPRASFSWFVLQLFLPHKKSKICTSIQKMSKFYFLQYFAVMHVRTTYLPIFFFQTSVCMQVGKTIIIAFTHIKRGTYSTLRQAGQTANFSEHNVGPRKWFTAFLMPLTSSYFTTNSKNLTSSYFTTNSKN